MAQSLAKYANDLKLDIKHLQQAHEAVGASETVINFLEKLYKIRNKTLYYLIFGTKGDRDWSSENYLIELEDEDLAKYTTLVNNFNKIAFYGSIEITGSRSSITCVKIDTRRVIDGLPSLSPLIEYKTPNSSDIELLESIPASPISLFQKENKTNSNKINNYHSEVDDFLAKKEDICSLIGLKISLSKKNYLSYMGHYFVLEAGRGHKWMIRSLSGVNKELISLFTRNNIILESDSDEDSESSDDE